MKKTKKLLALLMVAVLCFGLLTACGSSDDSSEETEAETEAETTADTETEAETEGETEETVASTDGYVMDSITVSCSSDGGTFDPFTRGGWGKMAVGDLIFQYLGDLDNDGVMHWTIAESVEANEDCSEYTITIHDCVYDSIGNHITADDVAWSLQSWRDVGMGSSMNLDHVDVTDDYTLIWYTKSYPAVGEIEDNLSTFPILSQDTYENYSNGSMANQPIGTGPYVLESYNIGTQFVLVANEDFWMLSLPEEEQANEWVYCAQNVKEIHYDIIQDNASIAMALENGDIDAADQLGESDIKTFKDMPDTYNIIEMTATPPLAIVFNCSDDSPCGDINLRQAIAYGLDTAYIAELSEILPAVQALSVCPNAYDAPYELTNASGRDYYNYDEDKATELLAASTYNGEELTLSYSSSTFNDYVATMIQALLSEFGINVAQNQWDKTVEDVDKYDSTAWDMRLLTMGGGSNYCYNSMKQVSSSNVSSYLPEGMNFCFVYDPEFDDLYNEVYNDDTEEALLAWDEVCTENVYVYALCNYSNITACRNDIMMEVGKKYETIMPNTVYYTN